MFHMKNPAIARVIINKNNKYRDPPILETEESSQTSEWIRSKILMDVDSLVLKGRAICFPNWHKTQSRFFVDTKPNKPLETNYYTWEEDVWPNWACQSAREWIEETTATVAIKIGATSRRRKLFMGNICPTLGPIPRSCLVLGSCTIHPE